MKIILVSLVIVSGILSFCKISSKTYRLLFVIFAIILILLATFRPITMADYQNYLKVFNGAVPDRWEPGFMFFVNNMQSLKTGALFQFFFFALISISLNLFAIQKFANIKGLSLSVYIANLLLYHDFIQIRCAIACGILIFTIPQIFHRNYIKFMFLVILASLFHYSSIIFFALYFLNPKKIRAKLYFCILIVSYALSYIGITMTGIIFHIPINFIQVLIEVYNQNMLLGENIQINIFSVFQIFRFVFCYILLFYSKNIIPHNKYSVLWIKMYTLGVASFALFSDWPVISFRISELLQCIEFLVLPMVIYSGIVRQKQSRLLIVCYSFLIICVNLFYNDLIL